VDGAEIQHTGMAEATAGLADVRAIRPGKSGEMAFEPHDGELVFGFALEGTARLDGSLLGPADSFAIPPGKPWALADMSGDFRLLHVTTARLDDKGLSPL